MSGSAFSTLHPAVEFLYFVLVIGFSMFYTHPACLAISLACASVCCIHLCGVRRSAGMLKLVLPVMLLAAIINPAFNHRGVTILAYLPGGNPLTLESLLYGAAAASLLAAVMIWFVCYSEVIGSDKFIYLFGRIIPALSLVLSMTLRFVPRFSAQLRRVREAQAGIGRDVDRGAMRHRVKNAVRILSIMTTWALENAIETADSMKGRGYGLPGRTAFSIYRFDERDGYMLSWLCFSGGYVFCGGLAGAMEWSWYPSVSGAWHGAITPSFYFVYLALCITPVAFDALCARKWKRREKTCSKA